MATQIQVSPLAGADRKQNLLHWANLLYFLIFVFSALIAIRPTGSTGNDRTPPLDPALLTVLGYCAGDGIYRETQSPSRSTHAGRTTEGGLTCDGTTSNGD